ncbi:hypothetical protein Tco_1317630 [Tanacetum coccineum]
MCSTQLKLYVLTSTNKVITVLEHSSLLPDNAAFLSAMFSRFYVKLLLFLISFHSSCLEVLQDHPESTCYLPLLRLLLFPSNLKKRAAGEWKPRDAKRGGGQLCATRDVGGKILVLRSLWLVLLCNHLVELVVEGFKMEGKAPMVEEDIQATHKTKEQMRQDNYFILQKLDAIKAKLEANAELTKDVLGKDLPEQDFAKRMAEMVNQRKKHFAEERAKAKRNKPMTQSQFKNLIVKLS